MTKFLNVIENIMDNIARYTLMIVFTIMFVVGLFIKAMYNFNDSPYFEFTTVYDVIAFIVIIGLIFLIYKKREWIQNHINYKVCFGGFTIVSLLYIWQVPLIPFSDMSAIYEGAIKFAQFDFEGLLSIPYWQMFPGNLVLAVFWGIVIMPFPKTLLTFKLINAIMLYGIIFFTRLIAREYKLKYYNVVYLLILTFSPLFLYINMIYFDIPLILFCVIGVYIYKKYDNIILAFVFIGISSYLRRSGVIFMIAIVFLYLFDNKDMWKTKRWFKKIIILICAVAVHTLIYNGGSALVKANFIDGNFVKYPVWNLYYMGINEEEFGFQNNDFSYDRNAQDVIERIIEYGPERLTKIIMKKTFWLWTQGTYQAQRYAFGSDCTDVLQKFEYETFATKYLMKDSQICRKLINSFMRAQYYSMFGLMILTICKRENVDRFKMFYYVIIATFLIMLIYELKSRYILQLSPFMIIMAGVFFEKE